MAYRWSLDGPGFEFPTPYTTENRFLRWRGWALLALALLLVMVLALAGDNPAERPVLTLENLPEPGSVWPHVLVALLLGALGGMDLLRASRQQMLLLVPGQPASLIVQVRREGSGSSPGAPWLMRALGGGKLAGEPAAQPPGPWARRLAARLAQAPTSVQAYVQLRLSQGVLVLGLSLLLAVTTAALGPWLLNRPAAWALIALLLAALGAAVVVRHVLEPETPPLTPLAVGLLLGAALLLSMPLAVYADRLPLLGQKLQRLGLPWAVAVLLAGSLVLQWLGVWAARADPDLPKPTAHTAADELSLALDNSPVQLMREIDLELHRRWPDGVPNRRYAWLPPQLDPALADGPFTATVLEESQPRFAPPGGFSEPTTAGDPDAAAAAASRRRSLLALNTLALLFSVAGGLLWARVTQTHMRDGSAPWTVGCVGLACLLLGAQALRVAHVLWSRIEVASTITWLDFHGSYVRSGGAAGAGETAWARNEVPARIESVTLRACVAQVQSVFYAAAGDDIGSRTLLGLAGDAAAAGHWLRVLEGLVRSAETPARATAVPVVADAPIRERRVPDNRPAPPPRRPVRFCPECGTPVLQGARFCQHCGSIVGSE